MMMLCREIDEGRLNGGHNNICVCELNEQLQHLIVARRLPPFGLENKLLLMMMITNHYDIIFNTLTHIAYQCDCYGLEEQHCQVEKDDDYTCRATSYTICHMLTLLNNNSEHDTITS